MKSEVHQLVRRINDTWRSGRVDDLERCFHPDMVIVGPAHRELARGREACIASYRDFLGASVVHEYRESDLAVRAWGRAAVTTYRWEMRYEQGGRTHEETGTDLFVFERCGDDGASWQAVWRMVMFSPKGS
jgi:hypothetical protein